MESATTRDERRPLNTIQQKLAERFLPMARKLARPLKSIWPNHRDEFESAACLALVEAAESFDPDRNVKFATFARHRIKGAMRDVQRQLLPQGYKCSGRDGGVPTTKMMSACKDVEIHGKVLCCIPDPPVGQELEAIEEIEGYLRKLPPRHAAACRSLYVHGHSQADAATQLGVSQSRLSYMHREAVAMLNGSWVGLDHGRPPEK